MRYYNKLHKEELEELETKIRIMCLEFQEKFARSLVFKLNMDDNIIFDLKSAGLFERVYVKAVSLLQLDPQLYPPIQ